MTISRHTLELLKQYLRTYDREGAEGQLCKEKIIAAITEWTGTKRLTLATSPRPDPDEVDAVLCYSVFNQNKSLAGCFVAALDRQLGRLAICGTAPTKKIPPLKLGKILTRFSDDGQIILGNDVCFIADKHSAKPRDLSIGIIESINKNIDALLRPALSNQPAFTKERDDLLEPLLKAIRQDELSEFRGQLGRFYRQLDPKIVHLMRKARVPATSVYSWLAGAGHAPKHDTQACQRNRQQAFVAFPALINMFMEEPFTAEIDANRPLIETIIKLEDLKTPKWERHRVTAAFLRSIQGLRPCDIDRKDKWRTPTEDGRYWGRSHFENNLGYFSQLPPEWHPHSPHDWWRIARLSTVTRDWQNLLD